ncbi:hypothetical protein LR48_Vigan618s000500 [Vigna angularis]|uniref:Uncharacterized protein n=1 Tax=Phaseolus angularis TaxID=3914 RepID=A0A0L9TED8_PHAAN|nr:hypothetical protein LR48_Vigan618s000500 [Vigna angularis]
MTPHSLPQGYDTLHEVMTPHSLLQGYDILHEVMTPHSLPQGYDTLHEVMTPHSLLQGYDHPPRGYDTSFTSIGLRHPPRGYDTSFTSSIGLRHPPRGYDTSFTSTGLRHPPRAFVPFTLHETVRPLLQCCRPFVLYQAIMMFGHSFSTVRSFDLSDDVRPQPQRSVNHRLFNRSVARPRPFGPAALVLCVRPLAQFVPPHLRSSCYSDARPYHSRSAARRTHLPFQPLVHHLPFLPLVLITRRSWGLRHAPRGYDTSFTSIGLRHAPRGYDTSFTSTGLRSPSTRL